MCLFFPLGFTEMEKEAERVSISKNSHNSLVACSCRQDRIYEKNLMLYIRKEDL